MEFEDNSAYLKKNPIIPTAEYLVLAGDISYLSRILKDDKWFFEWCSDNFSETWYIPGNHEFYDHSDISMLEKPFKEALTSNVFFINNTVVHKDGFDMLFTPLFSKIADINNMLIRFSMNDFHRIFFHKKRMTIEDFNLINSICTSFLESELEKAKDPVMIFTHHLPSKKCSSNEHNESPLSEAFANNLDDLILRYTEIIRYWIFGHSHRSINMNMWKTSLLSNQLGYVYANEDTGFKPDMFIE